MYFGGAAAPGPAHRAGKILHGSMLPPPGTPGTIAIGPNVEQRLAEMQKQIDELRQQVKALQGGGKAKTE